MVRHGLGAVGGDICAERKKAGDRVGRRKLARSMAIGKARQGTSADTRDVRRELMFTGPCM